MLDNKFFTAKFYLLRLSSLSAIFKHQFHLVILLYLSWRAKHHQHYFLHRPHRVHRQENQYQEEVGSGQLMPRLHSSCRLSLIASTGQFQVTARNRTVRQKHVSELLKHNLNIQIYSFQLSQCSTQTPTHPGGGAPPCWWWGLSRLRTGGLPAPLTSQDPPGALPLLPPSTLLSPSLSSDQPHYSILCVKATELANAGGMSTKLKVSKFNSSKFNFLWLCKINPKVKLRSIVLRV